jgi:hypothetical protein
MHSHKLFSFYPAEVVAARCPKSNQWYRAKIIQVEEAMDIVVQFVDFGNVIRLSCKEIRVLEVRLELILPVKCV